LEAAAKVCDLRVWYPWMGGPEPLLLRKTLQRCHLVLPTPYLGLQPDARGGHQFSGGLATGKLMQCLTIADLGVAEVRSLDKAEGAVPRLATKIGEMVTAR